MCGPANSCMDTEGVDSPENYMTHYQDFCRETFSEGQIERMQRAYVTYRRDGGGRCSCAIGLEESSSGKSGKSSKAKSSKKGSMKNGGRGRNGGFAKNSSGYRRRVRGEQLEDNLDAQKHRELKGCNVCAGGGQSIQSLLETQYSTEPVPVCSGVTPSEYVKWFVVEGVGDEFTVRVRGAGNSADTDLTVTVVEGSCELPTCVTAAASDSSEPGVVELTFFGEDGETYYIVVTTAGYADHGLVDVLIYNEAAVDEGFTPGRFSAYCQCGGSGDDIPDVCDGKEIRRLLTMNFVWNYGLILLTFSGCF